MEGLKVFDMKEEEGIMKENIAISICIPTRNRASRLYETVKQILKYPNKDIEVLVVDNCSTDNTVELLQSIKDERFSFYRNEENLGASHNFFKALSLGRGKYLQALHDIDQVNINNISRLIDVVKDKDYAVITNHYIKKEKSIECKMPDAAYYLNMNSHYSYFMFNRKEFHKIVDENRDKILKALYTSRYTLINVAAEIGMSGTYFWNKSIEIIEPAADSVLAQYPSKSGDGLKESKYGVLFSGYETKGRVYNYLYLLKLFKRNKLFLPILPEIIYGIYESELKWATWNAESFSKNKIQRKRYGYYDVRKFNMLRANFGFYHSAFQIHQKLNLSQIIDNKILLRIAVKNALEICKKKVGLPFDASQIYR